jgi:hypothetical protein
MIVVQTFLQHHTHVIVVDTFTLVGRLKKHIFCSNKQNSLECGYDYGHMSDSRVSTPVLGFVPFAVLHMRALISCDMTSTGSVMNDACTYYTRRGVAL